MLAEIDDTDTSILGSQMDIQIQKRFIPTTTTATTYFLNFNNPIYNPHPGHRYAISSSSFTYERFTCFFDDDGSGNIRIYRLERGVRTYVNSTAGKINYSTGLVELDSLLITAFVGDGIKVNAVPEDVNVSTIRNQILLFADANISIVNKNTKAIDARVVQSSATIKTTSTSDVGLNNNSLLF